MEQHLEKLVVCGAAGAACLLALCGRRSGWGRIAALAAALLVPAILSLWVGPEERAATLPLLVPLLTGAVAYRLGLDGGRSLRRQPVAAALLVAAAALPLGIFLIAGLAQLLLPLERPGEPATARILCLTLGALLLIPDGSGALALLSPSRPGGRREGRIEGLHALLALVGSTAAILGLAAVESRAPADPAAVLSTGLPPLIASVAIGGAIGLAGGQIAARLEDGAGLLVHAAVLLVAVALGELAHAGSAPAAAIAAGMGVGIARSNALPDRARAARIESLDAGLAASAVLLALAGLALGPPRLATAGSIAALWIGAWTVRTLAVIAVGGLHRWFRPREVSWGWIVAGCVHSWPGTLSLGLLLASSMRAGSDGVIASSGLASALLSLAAISFLVEGTASVIVRRLDPDLDLPPRWERARGCKLAVHAGRKALAQLEEQGDLDHLGEPEREALWDALDRRSKVIDLELEDLKLGSARPDPGSVRWVEQDVLQAASLAVEAAVRHRLLSRRAAMEVLDEVAEWFLPGRRTEPRQSEEPGP